MIEPIKIANFLAKNSCQKWNSCRLTRVICRHSYRALAKISILLGANKYNRDDLYWDSRNTYPWPYRDRDFAPWPEERGTLVSDPARMVIRHSTSYVAWKIRELTGKWPTKAIQPRDADHAAEIASRERPNDAKYWVEFLAAQGYDSVCETLSEFGRYVGVNPNITEYGLVVWFESAPSSDPGEVLASTYLDGKFHYDLFVKDHFTWVRIG